MRIINLTQQFATPEQRAQGVFEPKDADKVKELLTFDDLPQPGDVYRRARELAKIAVSDGAEAAMIDGPPWLTGPLAHNIKCYAGMRAMYSFSRREVVENTSEDGKVTKVSVFRHVGWVEG